MRLDNAHIIDAKTPRKALKKQDGFTLIEVLVALTIFAVGLLAIAAMQTSAIRMNSTGNRITEISTVSIDRLENLMSLPYSDPWLEQAGNSPGNDSAGNPHLIVTTDGYTVRWDIADNILTTNTKTITLTVTGKGKRLSLTTVRAQSL
jgi:type IV pilus assembly protein PilV